MGLSITNIHSLCLPPSALLHDVTRSLLPFVAMDDKNLRSYNTTLDERLGGTDINAAVLVKTLIRRVVEFHQATSTESTCPPCTRVIERPYSFQGRKRVRVKRGRKAEKDSDDDGA